MAYPTVDKPYGLKPINLIGGQVFAGQTRQYQIDPAGFAGNIFYGDVVKIVSTGYIEKDLGEATATPVGIFQGCSYVNAQGQTIFAQYYPTGYAAPTGTYITAYVQDDPDVLFKAVLVAGQTEGGNGLTPTYLSRSVIGTNAELVQNAGLTSTGDSRIGLYATTSATTASLPIRIIDVVPDTANSSGNFVEVICKFNAPYVVSTSTSSGGITTTTTSVVTGGHQYLNPVGV
jgi:hypothetical protein